MNDDTTMIDLAPAARQVAALLDGVADDMLHAPTPCGKYVVGDLLDHLMGLTVAFRHGADKTSLADSVRADPASAPSGPGEATLAHLDPEWRTRLPERLDALVAAWRSPAAWEGTAEVAGIAMPAPTMGAVALDELVIHGWDLARATGQPFDCDARSVEVVIGLLSQAADGSGNGMFGSPVAVPEDASPLDRAVGLSGRDPSWTA